MIQGSYDQKGQPRVNARVSLTGLRENRTIQEEFAISTGTPMTLIPQRLAEELGWIRPGYPPTQQFRRSERKLTGWTQPALVTLTPQEGNQTHRAIMLGIIPQDQWVPGEPPTMGMDVLQGLNATFCPRDGRVELHPL